MVSSSFCGKAARRVRAGLGVLVASTILPQAVPGASGLLESALDRFPPDTIRLEYSRPAVLRSLPNYSSLKSRFVGPRLREIENSLNRLGVRDEDIDEVVLGWELGGKEWELFGVTSGRFNASRIRERAAAQGFASSGVEGSSVYCFGQGAGNTCITLLDGSTGAFGPLDVLTVLAEPPGQASTTLKTNAKLSKALSEVDSSRPIWGIAVGSAVSDWFKGWMPNQGDLQLDWTQAFKAVEALAYSVEPTDVVRLNVRMDCSSDQDAASLGQVLQGIKIFQQLAWQQRNPNRENPYKDLDILSTAQTVQLQLRTDYASLEQAALPGST